MLAYLNRGGTLEDVATWLENATAEQNFRPHSIIQDVNGDSVPDRVLDTPRIWVTGCRDGQYVVLYENPEQGELERILEVGDVNRDGVAEITFCDFVFRYASTSFRMLAWDGEVFVDLFMLGRDDPVWLASTTGRFLTWYGTYGTDIGAFDVGGLVKDVYFHDRDGDSFQEFYLDLNTPNLYDVRLFGSWRPTCEIYTWDGWNYTLSGLEINPPQYRFQTVQDGDRLSFIGRYDEALDLYQMTIFSDNVSAWSRRNYQEQIESQYDRRPTPTPIPYDAEEYGHLAAYARYRIMLLHLAQGHLPEAQVVYDTLQAKFPAGAPGHRYAQTAATFCEQHQASQILAQACQVVIREAATDPAEFFSYLGNTEGGVGDFGTHNHTYLPEDACSFK